MVIGHPAKHELFALAEHAVGRRDPVSVRTAGHVARCKACAAHVAAMRSSLGFVAEAPALEVSADFARDMRRTLVEERQAPQRRRNGHRSLAALCKGMAYAAALAVLTTVIYSAALGSGTPAQTGPEPATAQATAVWPSMDVMRKTVAEIETLASAINRPSQNPPSLLERARRRSVLALNDDIEMAAAALERNPGCLRARYLINANLQRQAQTLRALYVERPL